MRSEDAVTEQHVAYQCPHIYAVRRMSGLFTGGFWAPYATFVTISVGYAIVAGSLVAFVEPLAAGSGIPEIKTYLNGIHIKGLLTVRQLSQAACHKLVHFAAYLT